MGFRGFCADRRLWRSGAVDSARRSVRRDGGGLPSVEPMRADTDPIPAAPGEADDLVGRLRDRRSADHVAAAYAAMHGHAIGTDDDGRGRRLALGARPGLVALVGVLLLVAVTGAVVLVPGGDGGVRPLTAAEPPEADAVTTADPAHSEEALPAAPGPSAVASPAVSGGSGPAVVTHVVGEVREPGLVELPSGARIADAVQAAGGPTDKADLSGVNLARPVTDGEQILVPRPGEAVEVMDGAGGTGADAPGATTGAAAGGDVVDVNTADIAALETLPGIGPALAQAVIEWRTENGPFASVDELEDVPGIGPSVLADIREQVRV